MKNPTWMKKKRQCGPLGKLRHCIVGPVTMLSAMSSTPTSAESRTMRVAVCIVGRCNDYSVWRIMNGRSLCEERKVHSGIIGKTNLRTLVIENICRKKILKFQFVPSPPSSRELLECVRYWSKSVFKNIFYVFCFAYFVNSRVSFAMLVVKIMNFYV